MDRRSEAKTGRTAKAVAASDDALCTLLSAGLRVQAGEDDEIVYLAQPNGGPGVGFYLVRAEGTTATFENPTHDFPQRIRYARDGDMMVATISRLDGSDAMSWTYRRQ